MLGINRTINYKNHYYNNIKQYNSAPNIVLERNDAANFSSPDFIFRNNGNVLHLITFKGLGDPEVPAIQMRVTGVTHHQRFNGNDKDIYINDLARGEWRDGQQMIGKHEILEKDEEKKGSGGGGQAGVLVKEQATKPTNPEKDTKEKEDKEDKDFTEKTKIIALYVVDHGIEHRVGRVPDKIAAHLLDLTGGQKGFRYELSNVVAGTTKGAETIGLRVNLIYDGGGTTKDRAREVFNQILDDPECADKVMRYQPETSPKDVLNRILNHEATKTDGGTESSRQMREAIENIVNEIAAPKNKRILLLGHCKPDGDTIGCVLALKNAIGMTHPEKEVDCSIDDKIPGLFRHKMPGIEDIKYPDNQAKIDYCKKTITELQNKEQTLHVQRKIDLLEAEIKEREDSTKKLDKNKTYDLVILMDVPTPNRFTDSFKQYITSARKVIYIDHHPLRANEWQEAKDTTGVDIKAIQENHLAWIATIVPAATQLVAIIADKLARKVQNDQADQSDERSKIRTEASRTGDDGIKNLIANPNFNQKQGFQEKLKAFVAGAVVGMWFDTGAFTRTANLLPEHIKSEDDKTVPVHKRPDYRPEGMAKWLMNLTAGTVTKKWLRDNINYDISDKIIYDFSDEEVHDTEVREGKDLKKGSSAREQMLRYTLDGKSLREDLSLGFVQVNYDQMNTVWAMAQRDDEETTLLDVQNAFKYSEAMGILRENPANHPKTHDDGTLHAKAKQDYEGKFDKDRIAVLICQDRKKG